MSKQDKQWDQVDRKVLDDVARVGWSDMAIFPTKDEPGLPFNYTVGLCEMDHPEILVMGMDPKQMHGLLSWVVEQIRNGVNYQPNTYSEEVLANGFHVAWVEVLDVHHEDFPLNMATRLFGDISAIQLIWPDQKDRFPWHVSFDSRYKDRQVLTGPWMGPLEVE